MSDIESGGLPELSVEQDFTFQLNILLNASECKWIISSHLPGAAIRGHTYPLNDGGAVTLTQTRNRDYPDILSNTMIITSKGESIADGDVLEWSTEGSELSDPESVERVTSVLEDIQKQRAHPNGDVGDLYGEA